jgi:hypothetical protein
LAGAADGRRPPSDRGRLKLSEDAMQTRHLLSVVVVLSTVAFAAAATARTPPQTDDPLLRAAPAISGAPGVGVFPNANECEPNTAEPAWSGDGRLLGYRCVTPSANGA